MRLSELRNRWWFPDHLVVAPLWEALRGCAHYAHGDLLDLGCGNAPYRAWFAPHVRRYITADHPPVAAAVQVACSSERLPFRSACFDTILCTQVLEHVPHPWQAAVEIARVLRAGGVLILSCPQYWPLHEVPHDYFRYTVYGLKSLFPPAQWEWLEHHQQGRTWAVIGCALWQSFATFGRGKRLLALVLNPLFLLLDRLWKQSPDTTNHLVVLRRRADPPAAAASAEAETAEAAPAR